MPSDSTILERVIKPERAGFSPELARNILAFDFPPADHQRYQELSAKASEGTLSETERAELEEYLEVNDLLTIIKAQAEASLRSNSHHELPGGLINTPIHGGVTAPEREGSRFQRLPHAPADLGASAKTVENGF